MILADLYTHMSKCVASVDEESDKRKTTTFIFRITKVTTQHPVSSFKSMLWAHNSHV